MDLYDRMAQQSSRRLTNGYSTSFRLAARLLAPNIRQAIYDIYGLVRLADEVVDTYGGADAAKLLDALETDVYAAIKRGYSTNMIVHAFAKTARTYHIDSTLLEPFFGSMQMDAPGAVYTPADYHAYIHGSAEVVGLMCLRVFCRGDAVQYRQLQAGAAALGAAFQKTNFLRDLADDHHTLGRFYFPDGSFEQFDDAAKSAVTTDIQHDFAQAEQAMRALPRSARLAVTTAARLYQALLGKLAATPATVIRQRRVRIPNARKVLIALTATLGGLVRG